MKKILLSIVIGIGVTALAAGFIMLGVICSQLYPMATIIVMGIVMGVIFIVGVSSSVYVGLNK